MPIIVFQMLKIMTYEFYFSPGSRSIRGSGKTKHSSSTTWVRGVLASMIVLLSYSVSSSVTDFSMWENPVLIAL